MGDRAEADQQFEVWYRAEYPRLVSSLTILAGSSDVGADVAAEAFTRAYEHWSRVATMQSPGGWVRNVAVNLLRRRVRRAAVERRVLGRLAARAEAPPPALDPALWAAVRKLPFRQRSVLALRIVQDLSQAETARLLRMRPGTVSATLVAARRNLVRQLGETSAVETITSESNHA